MKAFQRTLPFILYFTLLGYFSHSFYVPQPTQRRCTLFCHHLQTPAQNVISGIDKNILSISNRESTSHLLQQVDALLRESKIDPIHIWNAIDQAHEKDLLWAKSSPLPFERASASGGDNRSIEFIHNPIEYESIRIPDERRFVQYPRSIAIRTNKSSPLLSQDEIQLLKMATESYWKSQSGESSSSRFTYQRKGNSEAHLSDVVNFSREVQMSNAVMDLVDVLLLYRVYPWIREAFLSKEDGVNVEQLGLYVYDSLFIRYNATEANSNALNEVIEQESTKHNMGAGQPLHRDLGYVSVNIMLNDPCEFDGGGTFYEHQLLSLHTWDEACQLESDAYQDTLVGPLKPLGAGHALAHFSSDRHAGVATTRGVRDILVIFVAVAETNQIELDQAQTVPRWERAARLKTTARSFCQQCITEDDNLRDELLCPILHLRLALMAVPNDGEAWHYLGMALDEFANIDNSSALLDLAIACLEEEGAKYTPCDARLYNNIGLAWEKKLALFRTNNAANEIDMRHFHNKIKAAYKNAVLMNSICSRMGCDVASDYERACLNFGLYLSYQNDFRGAIHVLERIELTCDPTSNSQDLSPARHRVINDARNLLRFCKKQFQLKLIT
jgi:hypothetical protein